MTDADRPAAEEFGVQRVAYLSLHTSPLLKPGVGDAGGMNVYIDELATTMAGHGVETVVFTRRVDPTLPETVMTPTGYRVVHVDAGPSEVLPIAALSDHVEEFADGVMAWMAHQPYAFDLVHSHYWLSGWAGLLIKRRIGLPLANSFHTLGRVKDATRHADEAPASLERLAAEAEVIEASDCVVASTEREAEELMDHYGADPSRLCLNPPGINHDIFRPGSKSDARRRLAATGDPLVLFVGRIQPLKGPNVAVAAFAKILESFPEAQMMVVGGPSGPAGSAELRKTHELVASLGVERSVRFWSAQQHARLAVYYQAADVILVPSRSESFGLVAAEAQATGLPVVAANVGGLTHVVADGESGILVDGWDPADYAEAAVGLLTDDELHKCFSKGAVEQAERFSWPGTAARLLELYAGITGHGS